MTKAVYSPATNINFSTASLLLSRECLIMRLPEGAIGLHTLISYVISASFRNFLFPADYCVEVETVDMFGPVCICLSEIFSLLEG